VQRVEISGRLTVAHIVHWKEPFLEAVKENRSLELCFGEVLEADLSFVQLLIATYKAAEKSGTGITVHLPLPETVRQVFHLAGMENHGSCRGEGCLWCQIAGNGVGEDHDG